MTKNLSSQSSTILNARVSIDLAKQVKDLASNSGETAAGFVQKAIENEVARRTMTRPKAPVTLDDLSKKLDQSHHLLASHETFNRQIQASLEAIAAAVGVTK